MDVNFIDPMVFELVAWGFYFLVSSLIIGRFVSFTLKLVRSKHADGWAVRFNRYTTYLRS